jgi:class 3 adenylate cyclase
VKPLGDGAMLRFAKSGDAVHGVLSVLGKVRDRGGLPPARAGVASGPLVMQDGDYYGRTVNRAARLLGVATANQVLVTAEVARTVQSDPRLSIASLGKIRLRGVADEIEAFAAGHA